MKFPWIFSLLISMVVILTGCNSTPKDATNTLVITENDEKVILEYLDKKTDDIAGATAGTMYSAFKLLGTDSDKVYIYLFKREYIKYEGQANLESGNTVFIPVVLKVKKSKHGISVSKHMYPRDGIYSGKDIKRIMPANIIANLGVAEIDYEEKESMEQDTKARAEKDLNKKK